MMYRLVKLQQQESQSTNEFDSFPDVAALLLCSCAALMQLAVSAHMWPLVTACAAVAVATLYLAHHYAPTSDFEERLCHFPESAITADSRGISASSAPLITNTVAGQKAFNTGRSSFACDNPERLIIEQKPVAHLTCFVAGAIVVAGLAAITVGDFYYALSKTFGISTEAKTIALVMGAALMMLLINHLRVPMRRVVFDRYAGVFWTERVSLLGMQVNRSAQMPIHHIVLIQQLVHRTNNTSASPGLFRSAASTTPIELNVVFGTGNRENITCEGNCRSIKQNAAILSAFLNVPIRSTNAATEPGPIQ